ncbi:hypothetical protein L1987_01942 [Smallanthus sonchifolius]|uniref:Uncharacterized protein n=1 Tax=Smallanthus sonchifolius TaxID=185202 RepID=A0ACB9K6N7_9ASTR|nr:hypothetical protein L1987_01942 [Smallanthus sonchifolius]
MVLFSLVHHPRPRRHLGSMSDQDRGGVSFFWSWSYWSTFLLTWAVVPILQGFEDAGDFTVTERLKTSLHVNLLFYAIVGSVAVFGLILLIFLHNNWFVFYTLYLFDCSHLYFVANTGLHA